MGSVLRNGAVASVVVAGGLLWACGGNGGSGDGTEPPTQVTAVRVTVTQDGDPAGGVGVGLFAVGGTTALASASTGADGQATFSNLDAGTFEVEVAVPEGTELSGAARRSVTVTQGSTSGVVFELTTIGDDDPLEVVLTGTLTFSPSDLTIAVGETVVWRNEVTLFHTVTPDGHTEWTEAQLTQAGQTFSHTFETAGTFPYFCVPHQGDGMVGVITVQ